jgi:hypothetical protein
LYIKFGLRGDLIRDLGLAIRVSIDDRVQTFVPGKFAVWPFTYVAEEVALRSAHVHAFNLKLLIYLADWIWVSFGGSMALARRERSAHLYQDDSRCPSAYA